jgi:hypothetical protein
MIVPASNSVFGAVRSGLPDVSNFIENAANRVRQIETDPASRPAKMIKPAAGLPERAL